MAYFSLSLVFSYEYHSIITITVRRKIFLCVYIFIDCALKKLTYFNTGRWVSENDCQNIRACAFSLV